MVYTYITPTNLLETTMVNWRLAYQGLALAGFTDKQISKLSGVSRTTINRVRNGTYPHDTHDPGYDGGKAVLEAISQCLRTGVLEVDPLTGDG